MIRLFSSFLFIILCFLTSFPTQAQQNEQMVVVSGFYKTILKFKEGGIPSRKNIEKLSPYISSDFRRLLLDARNAEEEYFRKTKGSVPPLVEGSFFYSLFEGADRYNYIKEETDEKRISYLICLEYRDPYEKHEKSKWQDRAILIKENDKWVVHDLELLGQWPFGSKGKLSEILRGVIKEGKDAYPSK
jgi:hypothetical protein